MDRHASNLQRLTSGRVESGPDDCWLWMRSGTPAGYGVIYDAVKQRQVYAHRLAYELSNDITLTDGRTGDVIMHSCDTPSCVNPSHLIRGTHQNNIADMESKGRNGRRGVPHPNPARGSQKASQAKLTETDIPAICADPRRDEEIAADYGISRTRVSKIKRRVAWPHVEVPVVVRHGRWPTAK